MATGALPDRGPHGGLGLQDLRAADPLEEKRLDAARPPDGEPAVGPVVAEQRAGIRLAEGHGRAEIRSRTRDSSRVR